MAALYNELYRLARRERWSAGWPDGLAYDGVLGTRSQDHTVKAAVRVVF